MSVETRNAGLAFLLAAMIVVTVSTLARAFASPDPNAALRPSQSVVAGAN